MLLKIFEGLPPVEEFGGLRAKMFESFLTDRDNLIGSFESRLIDFLVFTSRSGAKLTHIAEDGDSGIGECFEK